ncbi:MFS transporter [Brevibacillus sp. B_LB10_24]|uniref:MFS transporter n=1 Tax=Brevibacillus sp. B_LB10_24 TaxID=3380645 RepID=UPI0038BC08D6
MKTTAVLSKNKQILMMAAICIGAFISHFTATVVNVSLPYLSDIFHTDLEIVQWVTVGYLLAVASLLPVMGNLGDRLGHRVWEWLFVIQVPVIFVAALLAMRYIPARKQVRKFTAFDSLGMILFVAGVASTIFGISNSNAWGLWSAQTIATFLIALISFITFWLWESRHSCDFIYLYHLLQHLGFDESKL